MKVFSKFPVQDFIEIPIEGREPVSVKFKFPTIQQAPRLKQLADVCRYCVEDVKDLEDESGKVEVKLKHVKDSGYELPDELLLLLWNSQLIEPIALYYMANSYKSPEELKKK